MAIKTISIDDFSGGRTNFLDQTIIPPNICTSGSMNVWAPEGPLIKAPGFVLQSSFTASGSQTMPWIFADDAVSTLYKLYYRINQTATGGGASTYYLFASPAAFTDSLTTLGYSLGTISISGATLISATGVGTLWTANVTGGDSMSIQGLGRYTVSSVEDNTHLTLNAPGPSVAVATGSSYVVQQGLFYQEIAAAVINGSLYNSTTGDTLQQFNGSIMFRLAAGPRAAYLATHKNYLFAARSPTAESRLYWSAIKDGTTWPANNFVDIDVLNGKISGLFSYGSELIVFKTRGMYKVIGDIFDPANPTYFVTKIQTPPDFIFNNNYTCAIQPLESIYFGGGLLTFYGGGRVYQYLQGTTYIKDVSSKIFRDLPKNFGLLTDTHANTDQRVGGISYLGYYILIGLTDPNNGNNPGALMMDRKGSWYYLTNRNATNTGEPFNFYRMIIVPSLTTRPQLTFGILNIPKIVTCDMIGPSFGTNYLSTDAITLQTTNVAINGVWVSKEFNIEYGTFKWIVIYLLKQPVGNLVVQWSIDQTANVSYTLDMTTGRGQVLRAVIPINQKGSTIQLTLSNNIIGQTFKIYAIKIYYEESSLERVV